MQKKRKYEVHDGLLAVHKWAALIAFILVIYEHIIRVIIRLLKTFCIQNIFIRCQDKYAQIVDNYLNMIHSSKWVFT